MNESEVTLEMLQGSPLLLGIMYVFGLVVFLVFAGFFSVWTTTLVRWYHGQPILTVEPWRPRTWGLVDVLLVLLAAFVGQMVMVPAWVKMTGLDLRKMIEDDRVSLSVMAVGSLSYLVAMLCGIVWLILRYGASFKHMGLSLERWWAKLGLGLATAVMTLPIVAALSAAVNAGLKTEYDHPLINELKKEGTLSAYLLAVFSAVVVAPLVEEFFFRVLLQGWLQSVPWSKRSWWWLVGAGLDQSDRTNSDAKLTENIEEPGALDESGTIANPYAPPPQADSVSADVPPEMLPQAMAAPNDDSAPDSNATPPIWPSFVVGILFGLAHFDYGLSYIPLAVLGTVLGLLYRAKHSIWPCFLLHFALNSFSMASLGIMLLVEAAK